MLIYYRGSGAFASLALFLNVLLILAALAAFQATLTLPGIAGIVLTMGMAVDANVLIFERIREELLRGTIPRTAIDEGFRKAIWTIFDANLTTMFAAFALLAFGTGPIKGFAVTLIVGILASLFTAIYVTRFFFDLFYSRRSRLAGVSI
jgi:preprotein translocase subunit SecD